MSCYESIISCLTCCCPKYLDDQEKREPNRGLMSEDEKYKWVNVTGNVICYPTNVYSPRTKDELYLIVNSAIKNNRHIRAAGLGHSTSPLVSTNDVLIMSQYLQKIIINTDNNTVLVECGVNIEQLNTKLNAVGLCLPHAVVSNAFFVVPCITVGSHGSGIKFGGMNKFVVSVDLIDGLGKWRRFSKPEYHDKSLPNDAEKDPDAFNSVITSLGLCGIIYSMTLKVEPIYNVKVNYDKISLKKFYTEEGLAELKRHVLNDEVCEWNYYVYNDQIWIRRYSKTDEELTCCDCCCLSMPICCCVNRCAKDKNSRDRLLDAVSTGAGEVLLKKVFETPKETPLFTKLMDDTTLKSEFVVPVVEGVHWTHLFNTIPVKFLEIAFEVDDNFENARIAMKIAIDKLNEYKQKDKYPINTMIQARFTGESDALLSLSSKSEEKKIICWIEIVTFVPKNKQEKSDFTEFASDVGNEWMKLKNAHPHWAKDFMMVPDIVNRIHRVFENNNNGIQRFLRVRNELDPRNLFVNRMLAEVFRLS